MKSTLVKNTFSYLKTRFSCVYYSISLFDDSSTTLWCTTRSRRVNEVVVDIRYNLFVGTL